MIRLMVFASWGVAVLLGWHLHKLELLREAFLREAPEVAAMLAWARIEVPAAVASGQIELCDRLGYATDFHYGCAMPSCAREPVRPREGRGTGDGRWRYDDSPAAQAAPQGSL